MKTINSKNKNLLSNIIVIFLIIALPVFVWALVNLNFNYNKKAASGEPVCIVNGAEFTATFVHLDSTNPIKLDYELAMRNKDKDICPPTTYNMEAIIPNGWTAEFINDTFSLNPGESYGDNHVYLTAPTDFNNWPQSFTISYHSTYPDGHTGNQTIIYSPSSSNDDVFFKDNGNSFTITTTDQNPNISVNPQDVVAGKTYVLNVTYSLQNNNKGQEASSSGIPVIVLIDNQFKSSKDIPYSLVANHRDGASDTQSTSFTASGNETEIELQFDPNNIFKETDESNNNYVFSFPINPSPTPVIKTGDVNNDNKVNMIDIGIVVDEYDSTNPIHERADVNGNGKVDLIDIGIIIDKYEW